MPTETGYEPEDICFAKYSIKGNICHRMVSSQVLAVQTYTKTEILWTEKI